MQVFNALNSKEGHFKLETVTDLRANKSFVWSPIMVILITVVGVTYFGNFLAVSPNGLNEMQWVVCGLFAIGGCFWSYVSGKICT